MTITMQQSRTTHIAGNSTSLSFITTPQVGALVVVCCSSWSADLEVGSVTDNQGNIYTRDYKLNDQFSDVIDIAIYSCYNVRSSGTFTITVDPAGSVGSLSFSIAEFRGAAPSNGLDQTNYLQGEGTAASSGNITPTTNGQLLIGMTVFALSSQHTMTEDTAEGWGLIGEEEDNGTYSCFNAEYFVQTAAQQQDADWYLDIGASAWSAFIVSYKAAETLSPKYVPQKLQSSSTSTGTVGTQLSDSYDSNLIAHSLLIAACVWYSAGTVTCRVSSSNNGNWTPIGSPQVGTGNLNGYSLQLFYLLDSKAGADTVTMTLSSEDNYRAIAIHEFDQIDLNNALESSIYSGNVTASGNVITTGSGIATANQLDLIFCAAMVDDSVTSQGPRFTLDENPTFGGNGTEHALRFNTGTYTASFNVTGTTNASMILVAFKQSSPPLVGPNDYKVRIPYNGGLSLHTAAENTEWFGRYYEIIEMDSLVTGPNKICYFEAVAKTSTSMSSAIELYCDIVSGPDMWEKTISGIEIPTATTSYTLFRSQAFSLPEGDKVDFFPIIRATPGGSTSLIAWRIILLQGSGEEPIRQIESQIELGDAESKNNTSAEPLNNPKYWKYDAEHWDGSLRYFAEIAISCNGGTVVVSIQEDDGNFGNWSNKQIFTFDNLNGYTFTIPQMSWTPTDGRHYRVSAYVSSAAYTYNIYNFKFLPCAYEGSTTWQVGTYDAAYDILGGTSGSGELNQAKAQYFPVTKTHHVDGVRLSLKKTGNPTDNLVVDIVSVLTGDPLVSGTLAASGLNTNWEDKTITFASQATLTAGNYYIRITRSGARDASNYVSVEGQNNFDDNLGQAYNRDNNSWATINYDLMYRLISDVGIGKFETVDTILNTGDAGTGLQNMPILYDSSDYDNVTHSLRYAHDATNSSDSSKLVALPSTDITNATVTGANEQIAATPFSWPASGTQIDVNVINSTGQVNHGKIIDFITLGITEGNTIEESISLGKIIRVSQPYGQNIEESVDLGIICAVSAADQLVVQDLVILAKTVAQGGSELGNLSDTVTQTRNAAIDTVSQTNEKDGLTLARSDGINSLTQTNEKDGLTLARSDGISSLTQTNEKDGLTLARSDDITSLTQTNENDVFSLARSLGLTITEDTQGQITETVILTRSLGLTVIQEGISHVSEDVVLSKLVEINLIEQTNESDFVNLGRSDAVSAVEEMRGFVNESIILARTNTLTTLQEGISHVSEDISLGKIITITSNEQNNINETSLLTRTIELTTVTQCQVGENVIINKLLNIIVSEINNISEFINLSLLNTITALSQCQVGDFVDFDYSNTIIALSQCQVNDYSILDKFIRVTIVEETRGQYSESVILNHILTLSVIQEGISHVSENVVIGKLNQIIIGEQNKLYDIALLNRSNGINTSSQCQIFNNLLLTRSNGIGIAAQIDLNENITVNKISGINTDSQLILNEIINLSRLDGLTIFDSRYLLENIILQHAKGLLVDSSPSIMENINLGRINNLDLITILMAFNSINFGRSNLIIAEPPSLYVYNNGNHSVGVLFRDKRAYVPWRDKRSNK